MGNTLAEVDSALHIGEQVLPLALGALSIFAPAAAPYAAAAAKITAAAVTGLDAAVQANNSGKDVETIIADAIAALETGFGLPAGTLQSAATQAASDPSNAGAPGAS